MSFPRFGVLALAVGLGAGCGALSRRPAAARSAATPEAAKVVDLPAGPPLLGEGDLTPGPGARAPTAAERLQDGEQQAIGGFLGSVPQHRDDDACLGRALARLTVHAKGDTAVVSGRLELGPCLAASLAGQSSEVLSADETLRFYVQLTCDGVDLGRFDGQTYGSLVTAGMHPCAAARGAGTLVQTDDVQLARVRRLTPEGLATAEEGHRHVQAEGGRSGGPCRYELKDGRFTRGACEVISRDVVTRARTELGGQVVTSADEGKETFSRQDGQPAD